MKNVIDLGNERAILFIHALISVRLCVYINLCIFYISTKIYFSICFIYIFNLAFISVRLHFYTFTS